MKKEMTFKVPSMYVKGKIKDVAMLDPYVRRQANHPGGDCAGHLGKELMEKAHKGKKKMDKRSKKM